MRETIFIILVLAFCSCGDHSEGPEAGAVRGADPGPEDLRLAAMADTWKGPTRTDRVEAIIHLAKAGDAAAQFTLGNLYREGKEGLSRDYAKALESFLAAAAQGHAGAQFNLGAIYGNGVGVPRDDAKAMEWIRKAADSGHPMAKEMLERSTPKGSDRDG